MSLRACPKCGTLEQRGIWQGKPWVNLDPISGLCIDCLASSVGAFQSRRDAANVPAHDARMAQAGKDSD